MVSNYKTGSEKDIKQLIENHLSLVKKFHGKFLEK